MRIRQIKPEWWRDKTLMTRTKADTREFYQGLWMTADDAGWFEWDPTAIGAEVYPFLPSGRRERDIERHAAILEGLEPAAPHLIRHTCIHAEVPKMPQHQRVSNEKRVFTHRNRHETQCIPRFPAGTRGSPGVPAPVRDGRELVGNGKESVRERETVNPDLAQAPWNVRHLGRAQ